MAGADEQQTRRELGEREGAPLIDAGQRDAQGEGGQLAQRAASRGRLGGVPDRRGKLAELAHCAPGHVDDRAARKSFTQGDGPRREGIVRVAIGAADRDVPARLDQRGVQLDDPHVEVGREVAHHVGDAGQDPAQLAVTHRRCVRSELKGRGSTRHQKAFELSVKMRRAYVRPIERPHRAVRHGVVDELLQQRLQRDASARGADV